jgi:hypothetical protein
MILADVLSTPAIQGGALGLLAVTLVAAGGLVKMWVKDLKDVIATRDAMITSLLAAASAKDDKFATAAIGMATTQGSFVDMGKKILELAAVTEANSRERNRRTGA